VPAVWFGNPLLPQREAAPGFALLGFGPLQRMRSRGFGTSTPCDAQARLWHAGGPCGLLDAPIARVHG
jgi:hypothetical protein